MVDAGGLLASHDEDTSAGSAHVQFVDPEA